MSATGASWCLKDIPQRTDKCTRYAKGINGCLCNVDLSTKRHCCSIYSELSEMDHFLHEMVPGGSGPRALAKSDSEEDFWMTEWNSSSLHQSPLMYTMVPLWYNPEYCRNILAFYISTEYAQMMLNVSIEISIITKCLLFHYLSRGSKKKPKRFMRWQFVFNGMKRTVC